MLTIFPHLATSDHLSVKIGVVFSKADWNTTAVKAVDEAVEMMNEREDVLPSMRLFYSPIFSDDSSFKLSKTICNGIWAGFKSVVSALVISLENKNEKLPLFQIGPSSAMASHHAQSISNGLDIPYFETKV